MPADLTARILTEAGLEIGLGHLARCVALYDALEALGCACAIVVAGDAPAHIVGARRVRVADWRSPATAAEALAGADIAVVDSYLASGEVYAVVAEVVASAAYIDDTARLAYPRGFVVNGNPDAATLPWRAESAATRLLGVKYQLLRAEFAHSPERQVRERVQRVLVVSGGTDAADSLQALAAAARAAMRDAEIDVVDAPRPAAAMRDAMLAADVAVSAAGQTLYELAAVGTPTVAVTVAENQRAQAFALHRAGAVMLAGEWGETGTLEAIVRSLVRLEDPEMRAVYSAAARALVDGRGAERVAKRLVGEVVGSGVELRRATLDDEAVLLELANDPDVRATAFSQGVISADEHRAWFRARLDDPDALILLAWDGANLAAYYRFEVSGASAEVSLGLAPRYRSLGLGGRWLAESVEILKREVPAVHELSARVLASNERSYGMFERSGFVERSPQQGSHRVLLRSL
ncbi:MAG: bifunctional UDP-2,4-diacetamido-2,4,6-trideoxy-beta-L-altropyranose hydrolase/GNAT family N-acetyltransferase [Coriobacteriia bacterium]|nr:bifunctional UDP-2,4-diacetamido-2,4,6-trideoxy-beta-L-altropyranose hydrolase/GNAT family N-acetyltransferase [Coriobacteriia bacterium]